MKSWKRFFLILLVFVIILSLLLSSCGSGNNGNGRNKGNKGSKDKNDNGNKGNSSNANKITICHKTGNAQKPYKEIAIPNDAAAGGHASHEGDIIPAPAGGCPEK